MNHTHTSAEVVVRIASVAVVLSISWSFIQPTKSVTTLPTRATRSVRSSMFSTYCCALTALIKHKQLTASPAKSLVFSLFGSVAVIEKAVDSASSHDLKYQNDGSNGLMSEIESADIIGWRACVSVR